MTSDSDGADGFLKTLEVNLRMGRKGFGVERVNRMLLVGQGFAKSVFSEKVNKRGIFSVKSQV